jgi:hypothetical protein
MFLSSTARKALSGKSKNRRQSSPKRSDTQCSSSNNRSNASYKRGNTVSFHLKQEHDNEFFKTRPDDTDASINSPRKGESKAAVAAWITGIIKKNEKAVADNEEAIHKTKALIRLRREVNPEVVDANIFGNMKCIQSFETKLAKAKQVINNLETLLDEVKDEPTEEFGTVVDKHRQYVLEELSKPAVRPGRLGSRGRLGTM